MALNVLSLLIFGTGLVSLVLLAFSVLVGAGSSKRGRLDEWVERASSVFLNKLFEITVSERNYQTLLSSQNLLAVVREP